MEGEKWEPNPNRQRPGIIREGSLKPFSKSDSFKEKRVNWLLDDNNKQKEDLINECFIPQNVVDILNMPTGNKESKDEIIWHLDKKGFFNVKSAYHLAMTLNTQVEASQSD